MFEKFGEFDTYETFRNKAKELLDNADTNSIRELAAENGVDPVDAEDYITGAMNDITDPGSYAMARIDLELNNTKVDKSAAGYIATIAKQTLTSKGDQAHFRGRHFDTIMKALKDKAQKQKQDYACGSDRDMEKIIEAYYLQSEDEMKKVVNQL